VGWSFLCLMDLRDEKNEISVSPYDQNQYFVFLEETEKMKSGSVKFEGVFPILITPFHEEENLDLESLRRVVRFMVDLGMDGVTVLGVLGEASRLTDIEREQVIKTATEAAEGSIPVVVGTSHRGTTACRALSQMAESLGASGVMISPPASLFPMSRRSSSSSSR
jgi:dihydrodipicolinate synthase/N-acetylneuraminate lyase